MKFLLSFFFIATVATACSQDSIMHRMIFIGDAGEAAADAYAGDGT